MATLESPGVPATLRSHFVLMLKMLVSRGDLDYLSLEVWGWLASAGNELYNWGQERTHYPGQRDIFGPHMHQGNGLTVTNYILRPASLCVEKKIINLSSHYVTRSRKYYLHFNKEYEAAMQIENPWYRS